MEVLAAKHRFDLKALMEAHPTRPPQRALPLPEAKSSCVVFEAQL